MLSLLLLVRLEPEGGGTVGGEANGGAKRSQERKKILEMRREKKIGKWKFNRKK